MKLTSSNFNQLKILYFKLVERQWTIFIFTHCQGDGIAQRYCLRFSTSSHRFESRFRRFSLLIRLWAALVSKPSSLWAALVLKPSGTKQQGILQMHLAATSSAKHHKKI